MSKIDDIAKMEYEDDEGNTTAIAYSVQLQKEAVTLRKIEIAILSIIVILFVLILTTSFPTQFLHQLVC